MPRKTANIAPLPRADAPDDTLIDVPTFGRMLGLRSTTSIYERAKADPTFPRLINLSTRCTRVRLGDARAWIRDKAAPTQASPGTTGVAS